LTGRLLTSARWRSNRAVVAPPGAVELEVPRSRAGRESVRDRLAALAAGTPVVLWASAPFARRRVRRLAEETGVELVREYLAFPTAAAPAYLVDEAAPAIRFFIKHAFVVPPGLRISLLVELVVRAVRAIEPTRLLRLVAPGRVAVGRAV
jgi:hypothetical protein